MKVLLVTNYYPPEIGGASHLYSELAKTLLAKGHNVTVVTGVPRYNIKRPTHSKFRLLTREAVDGVTVVRTFIPNIPRKLVLLRGFEHFVISVALFFGCLCAGKHDVSIVYSPPLPLGLTALAIRALRGTRVIVNIQDLFPQEAIDLGLLTNPVAITLLKSIESFIYRKADHITTHSEGNRTHVVSRGATERNVTVVPNWVDTASIRPLPRQNDFRKSIGVRDEDFVVTFAGTLGFCQDLDVILEAAQLLRQHTDIRFVVVGEGPSKEPAMSTAARIGLDNIAFLPVQTREVYPYVLAASDLCLVTLNKDLLTPVVPSRMLTIMAAGRPVVAALTSGNDARKIVDDSGCGICVNAGDGSALAEAILSLRSSQAMASSMGTAGRTYVERFFSREHCISLYDSIITSVVSR